MRSLILGLLIVIPVIVIFATVISLSPNTEIKFEGIDKSENSIIHTESIDKSDSELIIEIQSISCKNDGEHMSEIPCTKEVKWYLSGAVMPVPPAGSKDIPNSDQKSKLKVSLANNLVILHGEMSGLEPDKTYTVFVSNGYTPFTSWGGKYPNVEPFDVKTNSDGEVIWEKQVKPVPNHTEMSVWFDDVRITLLISDNFSIA
ncbi:hypothetical protein [Nitrosopumilus sp. S4]